MNFEIPADAYTQNNNPCRTEEDHKEFLDVYASVCAESDSDLEPYVSDFLFKEEPFALVMKAIRKEPELVIMFLEHVAKKQIEMKGRV